MMTPAQLKAYEFKAAGRNAYKAEDVDAFFGEVAVNYEKLFRENSELVKRMSMLASRLEQYKNDEGDIKQAVMSAQKAANMIIKEAEDSVADAKTEAEKIIEDANAEAEEIKLEAERQAIADSELALSVAKDKAEEIIAKAKEKAHSILIAANDSASDTMGAANRTVTSESLHYDMLKKEVSEFRASILAQYKAHIELISKLPELAVEEASKTEQESLPEVTDDELDALVDSAVEYVKEESEDSVLEFVSEEETGGAEEDFDALGEEVVKTQLPYDFFGEASALEFVEDDEPEETAVSIEEFENDMVEAAEDAEDDESAEAPADIPISKRFSVDVSRINYDSIEEEAEEVEEAEDEAGSSEDTASAEADEDDFYNEEDEDDTDDANSFFSMFEKIDTEDGNDDEEKPKRRGFFRKKK